MTDGHAPNDTTGVAAAVREAASGRTALRVVGAGTWLDAGRPVATGMTLSVAALAGIVEYVPGDLTLTARAGTTLSIIDDATRAEGQMLALDPFGTPLGTLGATVATASAGPLAHAFGTPRDNVIGLELVDGDGHVVRAGGRVVKNVAGFDLVRLMTGAWGTLGVLTEVSVRLRPRPEHDFTIAIALPSGVALAGWLRELRALPLTAWALDMVNAPLAESLGLGRRAQLLARLAGNEPLVRAERASLATLGDVDEIPDDVWARLRQVEPAVASVLRVSARPSRLAELCTALFAPAAASVGLLAHASVERGIVRCILPGEGGFGLPRFDSMPSPPTVVVERLPAALWATHGDWYGHPASAPLGGPAEAPSPAARLTAAVRRAFDPRGILNPGILG